MIETKGLMGCGLIVLVFLGLAPAVHVLHELGHAIMAQLCGWQIKSITVGKSWFSYSWTWRNIRFRIGFPPFGGRCFINPTKKGILPKRLVLQDIAITASGVLFACPLTCAAWLIFGLFAPSLEWINVVFFLLVLEQLFQFLPTSSDGKSLRRLIYHYYSLPRDP